jgi:hypothetical protein
VIIKRNDKSYNLSRKKINDYIVLGPTLGDKMELLPAVLFLTILGAVIWGVINNPPKPRRHLESSRDMVRRLEKRDHLYR